MNLKKKALNSFNGISIRGLVAYAICCIENALIYFNQQDLQYRGWKFLLEMLWKYTSLPDGNGSPGDFERKTIGDIIYLADESFPDSLQQLMEGKRSPSLSVLLSLTEDEADLLYNAYISDKAISDIVCYAILVIIAEWDGKDPKGPTYMTREAIVELVNVMNQNNIPLPDIEKFRKYTWIPKTHPEYDKCISGPEYGLPFNGEEELSKILN